MSLNLTLRRCHPRHHWLIVVVKWCTSFCCSCFVSANAIIYSSYKYLITKPFLAVHHLAVRFEDAGTAVVGWWWASISSSLAEPAELWFYLKTPFVVRRTAVPPVRWCKTCSLLLAVPPVRWCKTCSLLLLVLWQNKRKSRYLYDKLIT